MGMRNASAYRGVKLLLENEMTFEHNQGGVTIVRDVGDDSCHELKQGA